MFVRPTGFTIVRLLAATAVAAFAAVPVARAAYVKDYPVTLTQPDGTEVRVLLTGDEFYNWAHDEDGYVIVRHPANGRLVYAREVNGEIAPTDYIARQANPRLLGLVPNIAAKHAANARLRPEVAQELSRRPSGPLGHNKGSFNNLVIFIRFSDEATTAFTHTLSEYDGMLNGAAGTNSMRNYYKEASYNALTINSLFYPGQSGTTVVSFQDSHPRAYFKPYDATTNPTGYQNDGGSREYNLLVAALNAVKPTVDASGVDTDSDNDGRVDNVVFIVDGDTTAWSTLLWPHMSGMSGGPTLGGATVGTYNFQLEKFLFGGRGVGVFCHEMFHSLGSPDLYHYTSDGMSPAGPWDLMEADQNPPQHMTAFMKWKYGTWIDSIPEITTSGRYSLQPLTSSTNNCYKIRCLSNPSQYFVLEYRRKTGTFENSVPGSGLIVTRINTAVGNGNADGPPDEVYIYRPNGTTTANGSVYSAYFSSTALRTALNSTTNPTPFLADGSPGLLDIRNVGSAGTTISFDVNIVYPPATHLGFAIQPVPARPGIPFAPQPVVAALTDQGQVNPNVSGVATVALKAGTGTPGATLSGVKTVSLQNGQGPLSGLSIDLAGTGYVLTASTTGLTSGDSAAFSVTPSGATTRRVNLSSSQAEAERPWSDNICVSADGRFVAFNSAANNLVPGNVDTNSVEDVFIKNLATGAVQLASVSSSGVPGNGNSGDAALSGTGGYVVFDSAATNLVAGDTNGATDVFLRNLSTGVTVRVSVGAGGAQANSSSYSGAVSDDGRYVAFQSWATNLVSGDTNSAYDIFVRDLVGNTTERINVSPGGAQATGGSSYRHITMSSDGAYVAFQSNATNLVTGDTNGQSDVFLWSRATHSCERLSVATGGAQANGGSMDASISPDGRYAVFVSSAPNLVSPTTNGYYQIFFRDRTTGVTERISVSSTGGEPDNYSWFPDVSPDGRHVLFGSYSANLVTGDTNGTLDIFLRDRQLATTRRVNTSTTLAQANDYSQSSCAGHSIGAGPMVVFRSAADNLVAGDVNGIADVFARNVVNNVILRASAGPGNVETGGGGSYNPFISRDGRYVVFQSNASNMAPGNRNNTQDIYLRDMQSGATERVSLTDAGTPADSDSYDPSASADAGIVSFTSSSGYLVSGGDGGHQNIYVRDRTTGHTTWVSTATSGNPNGNSYRSSLSGDGRYVAFISAASNLVANDTNGQPDVFLKDMSTGTTRRVSVSGTGVQGNGSCDAWLLPRVSDDGRYVAFASLASNLVANDTNGAADIFVYDTLTSSIQCVSVDTTGKPGNATSQWAAMSADGRFVAFMSDASNLVTGDTNGQADIFVRDRLLGRTTRISLQPAGGQNPGNSRDPFMTADGRYVLYKSSDGGLVAGDNNGQTDAFVFDMATGQTMRLSVNDSGIGGNGETSNAMGISLDGRWAVFQSMASNLVPGDNNAAWDIFMRGPLWTTPLAYTLGDAATALQAAGGLATPTAARSYWLDVVTSGSSQGKIQVVDAVKIARKVAGLEANP